jgi:hypothetical protein
VSLELIRWRDAYFDFDRGGDIPDRDDYIVETVGWTEDREKFLTINSERLPEEDGYRAASHIPWGVIIERISLEPADG